jgi:hypothetical protein
MPSVRRTLSIIEAGSRLVLELPWCREKPEEVEEKAKIRVKGMQYRLTYMDRVIAEGEVQAHRIEVDLTGKPSGVYKIQILGSHVKDGGIREFWAQQIFVQTSVKRSPEEIDAIARRYAPIFLFSRKEDYFPVSLQDLVKSPTLLASDSKVVVQSAAGEEQIAVQDLDEFLRYNGNQEFLLDQSMFDLDGIFKEIRGDFRRSVVYYSYLEDQKSDRFFINYHTFYAFDPKTGIAKLLNVGPHVFDRESMTIVFNADGKPESMVLSGHLENQPILFLEKLKIWNTGRVRLKFPDPSNAEFKEHPIVPVAEGSHALYPTAGLYHISLLTELAGHVFRNILPLDTDDDVPEMDTHQVLLPPSLPSEKFANYDLRPLRLDLLRSEPLDKKDLYDPATAVLTFSGYWVDVPGWQNERFPPFSRKEKEIEDWVDQAYLWDWKDLPAHIVEHNKALNEYVGQYVKSANA